METCLDLLKRRNKASSSVLAELMIHGRRGAAGHRPDFARLDGLLAYTDRIVRARHYRDEEALILKPLADKAPECRWLIGRVRRDHVAAGGYGFRLGEAIQYWKNGWSKAVGMYLDNASDYWHLATAHGRLMREQILPAAMTHLPAAHWTRAKSTLSAFPDAVAAAHGRDEREAALRTMIAKAA